MLDEDVIEKTIVSISNAELLIVGGNTLVVQPAVSFVKYFKEKHPSIINKMETEYNGDTELVIRENIGEVFKKSYERNRVKQCHLIL